MVLRSKRTAKAKRREDPIITASTVIKKIAFMLRGKLDSFSKILVILVEIQTEINLTKNLFYELLKLKNMKLIALLLKKLFTQKNL